MSTEKGTLNKAKLNAVERDLIEGLEGFVADLKGDAPIAKKYTSRRVTLDLKAREFSPEQVKDTRKLLNASQSLFAQFLGVSPKTVAAWERGGKPVTGAASRFLDEIQRNPSYWVKRLKESVQVKSA